MLPRIYTYRNLWAICLIMLLGVFSACTDTVDDDLPSGDHYLTLSRVVIPAQNKGESVTINSIRVLVFSKSGSLVSNVYYDQEKDLTGTFDSALDAYILSIGGEKEISAYAGTNHVYVILNEATGGLTSSLTAEGLDKTKMDEIRSGKIPYTELIPVTDNEPGFVMCVYDEVEVTEHIQNLNMTGFEQYGTPVYGYGMRRTMAKVVLESVVGGVTPEGYIVGTNKTVKWNGNADVDQIKDDTGNQDLIATSAVHILGIELINVPTEYSWKQDGFDPTTYPSYTGTYHTDAIPIATSDFNLTEKYFDRQWPGIISGSGEVEFTRTDAMYSMWKVQQNSGKNAYEVYDPADVEANPDNYYYWAITGGSILVPNSGITCQITYADAMKTATNFSHYTIDSEGIVHLFNTSGIEFDAPKSSLYTLNEGNFTKFFQTNYGNMSGNFVPGRPIAGAMKTTPYIDPSVWRLNFNNVSYYIPENIPQNSSNYTKLRITASVAIPTVELDPEEVNDAINAQGGTGTLVGEEGMINMDDKNIINYLYAKGEMLPHPTKEGYYALAYAGLKRMYKGTVKVTNAKGRYEKMAGYDAQVVTIEVPLTNDTDENKNDDVNNWKEDTDTDHNIYRGREYRVKLYVTKSNEKWPKQTNTASRSINIGGEELTITGKVVSTPMN